MYVTCGLSVHATESYAHIQYLAAFAFYVMAAVGVCRLKFSRNIRHWAVRAPVSAPAAAAASRGPRRETCTCHHVGGRVTRRALYATAAVNLR